MKLIKLLMVDDNLAFTYTIKGSLELTGQYEVCVAYDGKEGLESYKRFCPDVIISDIEMPEMDGLEMVKQIRITDSLTPILFASAHTTAQDLINGYAVGANNYIRKPFLTEELNAHIQGVFRYLDTFHDAIKDAKKETLPLGKYQFKVSSRLLLQGDKEIGLTDRETQILWTLYQNRGNVVKRKDLLEKLWDKDDFYASRSLDVFVSRLRKNIEDDPQVEIRTVRGEGLQLIV